MLHVSLLTQQQEQSALTFSSVCGSVVTFEGSLTNVCVTVAGRLLPICRLVAEMMSDSFTPDVSGPAEPQERVGADRPPGLLLFLFVLF